MDVVRRLVGALAGVAVAGLLMGAASAAVDPPGVRGLSVEEARARLLDSDKAVTIQVVRAQLPAGVMASTVVVATATWLTPTAPGTAAPRPQVRLALGVRVPDLTGLDSAAATRSLGDRGLRLRAEGA